MTPFRSPAFRWLWSSSLASSGAQGLERTATAWLALGTGGGAVTVGLAFAARTLPSLLFGLAAGTLADRADRTRQVLAVAGAALPVMAGFAWMTGTIAIHTWHVVGIAFVAGCLQVFDTPARQALLMDAVPREAAPNAVALNAVAARLANALGALGAGALIPFAGVAACYMGVAAVSALNAALVGAVRVRRVSYATIAHPLFRRALGDAARLLIDVPAVRTLSLAGIACEVFAFSYATAVPVFATAVLATSAVGLGTLNAASAVGGTLSVVLLSLVPGRIRREPLMGAIFVLYGGAIAGLAATHDLATAAAVLVMIGACAGAFDVLQQTLLQLAVPESQRGRAVGIWVLGLGSAPLGHLEMGFVVASLGAPSALLLNGALVVAAAATLLAFAPRYRWTRPAVQPEPS